jgi:hypothetical protein
MKGKTKPIAKKAAGGKKEEGGKGEPGRKGNGVRLSLSAGTDDADEMIHLDWQEMA